MCAFLLYAWEWIALGRSCQSDNWIAISRWLISNQQDPALAGLRPRGNQRQGVIYRRKIFKVAHAWGSCIGVTSGLFYFFLLQRPSVHYCSVAMCIIHHNGDSLEAFKLWNIYTGIILHEYAWGTDRLTIPLWTCCVHGALAWRWRWTEVIEAYWSHCFLSYSSNQSFLF